MASTTLPQGMSEHDYEAIEAAVTETVRGRWFLGEFARRNRQGELGLVLDAVHRLEQTVTMGQAALAAPAPADPSVRLLMQRIKEISGQLGDLSREMSTAGADPLFVDAVEHQARAVAGMMRAGVPGPRGRPDIPSVDRAMLPSGGSGASDLPAHGAEPIASGSAMVDAPSHVAARLDPPPAAPEPSGPDVRPTARMPRADLPVALLASVPPQSSSPVPKAADPRLAILSSLDGLPLSEKLALFS